MTSPFFAGFHDNLLQDLVEIAKKKIESNF